MIKRIQLIYVFAILLYQWFIQSGCTVFFLAHFLHLYEYIEHFTLKVYCCQTQTTVRTIKGSKNINFLICKCIYTIYVQLCAYVNKWKEVLKYTTIMLQIDWENQNSKLFAACIQNGDIKLVNASENLMILRFFFFFSSSFIKRI